MYYLIFKLFLKIKNEWYCEFLVYKSLVKIIDRPFRFSSLNCVTFSLDQCGIVLTNGPTNSLRTRGPKCFIISTIVLKTESDRTNRSRFWSGLVNWLGNRLNRNRTNWTGSPIGEPNGSIIFLFLFLQYQNDAVLENIKTPSKPSLLQFESQKLPPPNVSRHPCWDSSHQ